MRPEFSEFSYAYALTEALVDGKQHLVQPTFPTQWKERTLGYDMRLDRVGYPIFLQFKVCHSMKRSTAREHAHFGLPLTIPFLRMPLMPSRRSPQHERLLALEKRGGVVFYAAPRFFSDNDFADHYIHRQILAHSAFIQPTTIGPLPDRRDHHIAFDLDARYGWMLSEPTPVVPILNGNEFGDEMHLPLNDAQPISAAVRTVILHVVDTIIIGDGNIPITSGAAYRVSRQVCIVIRQVYPDFPDIDTIVGTSDQVVEDGSAVSSDPSGTFGDARPAPTGTDRP